MGFQAGCEVWKGLDYIHEITSTRSYKLKVTLEDYNGLYYVAYYNSFSVGSDSTNYKLKISGYDKGLSSVGDSFTNIKYTGYNHNGMAFTTKDKDNDQWSENCSQYYGNGGWWFNKCLDSNLNGRSKKEEGSRGIYWYRKGNASQSSVVPGNSWKGSKMELLSH